MDAILAFTKKFSAGAAVTLTPAAAPSAQQIVASQLGGTVIPEQRTGGSGPREVRDKWNNLWIYDDPQAPTTVRGPAVKGVKQKRDGSGTYSKWFDPAKGPEWFPKPKPAEHELFPEQWAR